MGYGLTWPDILGHEFRLLCKLLRRFPNLLLIYYITLLTPWLAINTGHPPHTRINLLFELLQQATYGTVTSGPM